MHLDLGSRRALLTYCTNVHATDDVAGLIRALDEVTAPVARALAPGQPFGLGLRLGEHEVREILDQATTRERLEDAFARNGFFVFTINGFPQGRFHARQVKRRVYEPDWTRPERARYTLDLARLLADWLPEGDRFGTISTLPLGWRPDLEGRHAAAARTLAEVAAGLSRIEVERGARIQLCLEPEPGCAIETIAEVVAFFEHELLRAGDEAVIRRHLGVCWDTCHQAVLFEEPGAGLRALAAAGIEVGKVQISNALRLDFQTASALDPLLDCDEERFLHQVALRFPGVAPDLRRYEDLPLLSGSRERGEIPLGGEARCHFHVPIYAEAFPPLATTRRDLLETIGAVRRHCQARHFEVETYTFDVLPPALRAAPLGVQLVRELEFARAALVAGG